jgi:hypothetical protein
MAFIASVSFAGASYAAAPQAGSVEQFVGLWAAESGLVTGQSGYSLNHPLRYGRLSIKKAKKTNTSDIFGRLEFVSSGGAIWGLDFNQDAQKVDFPSPEKMRWSGKWYGGIDGKDYESKYEVVLELGADGVLTLTKKDDVSNETAKFKRVDEDAAKDSNLNAMVGGWKAIKGSASFSTEPLSGLPLQNGYIMIKASPANSETDVTIIVYGSARFKKSQSWQNHSIEHEQQFARISKDNPKKISWTVDERSTINGQAKTMTVRVSVELNDDGTITLKKSDKNTEATAIFRKEF